MTNKTAKKVLSNLLLTKLKNKRDAKKKKIEKNEKMLFLKILKMDLLIGGAFFLFHLLFGLTIQ